MKIPLARFTVTLAPRTKKNHGRVRWSWRQRRKVHVPSKPWEAWVSGAEILIPNRPPVVWFRESQTIRVDVNCRALFYRDANRGDAVGYYQGLADLLEAKRVVFNDRQIVSWEGSKLLLDSKNPRTDVVLEPVEG